MKYSQNKQNLGDVFGDCWEELNQVQKLKVQIYVDVKKIIEMIKTKFNHVFEISEYQNIVEITTTVK